MKTKTSLEAKLNSAAVTAVTQVYVEAALLFSQAMDNVADNSRRIADSLRGEGESLPFVTNKFIQSCNEVETILSDYAEAVEALKAVIAEKTKRD